jgi:hypothetical protein
MAKSKKKTGKPSRGTKRAAVRKRRTKSLASAGSSPVGLQRALSDSIEREISNRIETHQRDVVRLRAEIAARAVQPALMILAHGDSWFNYPLNGNRWPSPDTDIIAHLRKMGSPRPTILNISHYGDATTDEMGLAKQERLIDVLSNPKNWLTGKPDAILFSGGGNDIAGDPFCIYLNYKDSHQPGLDPERFEGRLASMRSSYLDLFLFRDRYAPAVPIFGHCYDYAQPMEPHPPCTGPWMLPSLKFTEWNPEEGAKIVADALDRFKKMVDKLEASGAYNFTVVQTHNTLVTTDWANELHPHPPGFKKLAQRFLEKLQDHFRGRI